MKPTLRNALFYAACIAAIAQGASAAPSPTNNIAVPKGAPTNAPPDDLSFKIEMSPDEGWNAIILEKFAKKAEVHGINTFLCPEADFRWYHAERVSGYHLNNEIAAAGTRMVKVAGLSSLRESALALVPEVEESQNIVNKFLAKSIGNTSEESLNPSGFNSFEVQRSYWEDMQSDGSVSYGLRPLDDRPYAYIGGRFGHYQGGPLGTFDIRNRYDIVHRRSVEEAQLTFFATRSLAITFGTSYYPTVSHGEAKGPDYSMMISHEIINNKQHEASVSVQTTSSKEHGFTTLLGASLFF
jgi:hypothetical protein